MCEVYHVYAGLHRDKLGPTPVATSPFFHMKMISIIFFYEDFIFILRHSYLTNRVTRCSLGQLCYLMPQIERWTCGDLF